MQLNLLLTLRAPPLSFILAICITALRITGIYPISNPTLKRTASQPLSSNVSPFIFPLYAGRYLFQRFAFLKGFSFGV